MTNMGRDFAAPKQGDIKEWKIVEQLAAANIKFHSCGCTGPGWRPRKGYEADKFIDRQKKSRRTEGERLLEAFAKKINKNGN